ncbi:MAG TPA: PPK2 family polyphosphate kinase [Acidimicrobiales bacterium]|nr:PPK2 family polyphosphate kinase [Acidimicrobiales bacterium]
MDSAGRCDAVMKLPRQVINELRVQPGQPARLSARSTKKTTTDWLRGLGRAGPRELADRDLDAFKAELQAAQELLYANGRWALLLIFQALDAAGKDGTIKHVMSGVNPQGCEVVSFKQPSREELDHDILWRCARALPARGRIGIFNRSYYEEVLVVRVHPELLTAEHLPLGQKAGKSLWRARYEDINTFERHLARDGTRIVKFFLHVSKEEQRRRFLQRIDDPARQWKVSPSDMAERAHFDDYQRAYEDVLTATSTPWAPWYVVPADHKHQLRALVGAVVVDAVRGLKLKTPAVDEEKAAAIRAARERLLAEGPARLGRGTGGT